MKVSQRGLYALKALVHLAEAYDRGVVKIRAIAEAESIPEKFLEGILLALRNARVVASQRGREGGYQLRRPPAEILLGDVVRLIDGPLFVGEDYVLRREIVALAESKRTESYWVRTRIFDASGERQVAEMLLNHATLKHSYAGYADAS